MARRVASGTAGGAQLWNGALPPGRGELVRELYRAETRATPSLRIQDMWPHLPGSTAGLRRAHEGGYFPATSSPPGPGVARWLESVLQLVPVNQRPEGYNPRASKPGSEWVRRLANGKICYDAILRQDLRPWPIR